MKRTSLILVYLSIIFISCGNFLPHELHIATTHEPEINKAFVPGKQSTINITQSDDNEKENMQMNERSHISDFTNPRTGLNPFLDLVEGAVTGSSRQGATIPEKSTAAPKPETQTPTPHTPPPYHRWPPDIMEGPSNPRQKAPLDLGQSIDEGTSRGRIHVFPTNLFPPRYISSTTTKEPVTVKLFKKIKPSTTRKCEPSKPLPVSQDHKPSIHTSTTPATIKKKEETTAREKNLSTSSINRNFTIGITIVGIAIIFFTVMLATCLWKQRTKQVPQRHTSLKNMLNSESMKRGMIHT